MMLLTFQNRLKSFITISGASTLRERVRLRRAWGARSRTKNFQVFTFLAADNKHWPVIMGCAAAAEGD